MAKVGIQPSICYNNTNSDSHASLTQAMNESDRKEPMKEDESNENG